MITSKQAEKMHCLDLLDLAKKDEMAFDEISRRSTNWQVCAVGEAAQSIGISVYELSDNDPNLYTWGCAFADLVDSRKFVKAKRLYNKIDKYVKKFYGTKAQLQTFRNMLSFQ